jgi:DegV family protein with EDD domain
MNRPITECFQIGCERLTAWADVIDRINVFPIADGDTGRNLVLSLAPLHSMGQRDVEDVANDLLVCARGHSGNIAASFFSSFSTVTGTHQLPETALLARERAWRSLDDPKPGTMLSVFDVLCETLQELPAAQDNGWTAEVVRRLEQAVSATSDQLPELEKAGVVDAGALGMFVFLDGFFTSLGGSKRGFARITELFGRKLSLRSGYQPVTTSGQCVDVVLKVEEGSRDHVSRNMRELGSSLTTIDGGKYLKAHLHTRDQAHLRKSLERLGSVKRWASDDLQEQTNSFLQRARDQVLHIVTDSAGSVTREAAAEMGITLLDSYVSMGSIAVPESCIAPEELYRAMRDGVRVTTSQASVFERHQLYEKILSLYPRALYLCVGSVFTGNHEVVCAWKKSHDPDNRLTVMDTGLASGKLGLAAIASARHSMTAVNAEEVRDFAESAVASCREYLFLEKLHYLAAGGRMSKTGSVVGDFLHMRPVVTPTSEGVKKVAVFRSREAQLRFLLEEVEKADSEGPLSDFLLQYTDNGPFLEETVLPELRKRVPAAAFLIQPVSNTSGAHMGPGTWGVAFLPKIES